MELSHVSRQLKATVAETANALLIAGLENKIEVLYSKTCLTAEGSPPPPCTEQHLCTLYSLNTNNVRVARTGVPSTIEEGSPQLCCCMGVTMKNEMRFSHAVSVAAGLSKHSVVLADLPGYEDLALALENCTRQLAAGMPGSRGPAALSQKNFAARTGIAEELTGLVAS